MDEVVTLFSVAFPISYPIIGGAAFFRIRVKIFEAIHDLSDKLEARVLDRSTSPLNSFRARCAAGENKNEEEAILPGRIPLKNVVSSR